LKPRATNSSAEQKMIAQKLAVNSSSAPPVIAHCPTPNP
jgi:hypothetical protein